jgi:hypothetical protein
MVAGVVLSVGCSSSAQAAQFITPGSHGFAGQTVGGSSSPFAFMLRANCLVDPANPMNPTCLNPDPFSPDIRVSAGFVQSNTCPPTMPGTDPYGTTCMIYVSFAPGVVGPVTGVLTAGPNGAAPFANLSGTGLAAPPAITTPGPPGQTGKKCKRKKRSASTAKKCKKKRG